jgi:hypothetical protein
VSNLRWQARFAILQCVTHFSPAFIQRNFHNRH